VESKFRFGSYVIHVVATGGNTLPRPQDRDIGVGARCGRDCQRKYQSRLFRHWRRKKGNPGQSERYQAPRKPTYSKPIVLPPLEETEAWASIEKGNHFVEAQP
jgi:hypothetical protein